MEEMVEMERWIGCFHVEPIQQSQYQCTLYPSLWAS